MAEPNDDIIGVVVAGAPVPALRAVVRAELHSAKWDGGAGIDMPVFGSADEGVDVLKEVVGFGFILGLRLAGQQAGQR